MTSRQAGTSFSSQDGWTQSLRHSGRPAHGHRLWNQKGTNNITIKVVCYTIGNPMCPLRVFYLVGKGLPVVIGCAPIHMVVVALVAWMTAKCKATENWGGYAYNTALLWSNVLHVWAMLRVSCCNDNREMYGCEMPTNVHSFSLEFSSHDLQKPTCHKLIIRLGWLHQDGCIHNIFHIQFRLTFLIYIGVTSYFATLILPDTYSNM